MTWHSNGVLFNDLYYFYCPKKVHLFLNIIITIQNTFVYVRKIENALLEYLQHIFYKIF